MPKKITARHIYGLILPALLLFAYWVTFSADFLPWDDDYNITLNPIVTHGYWLDFWLQPFYGMYIPVTSTIWKFIYQWGGGSSFPFRVFNFSLHLVNIFLVYRILKSWCQELKLTGNWLWVIGVTLYALHPLQVDVISWISGGRDLLATTLALTAWLVYFRWTDWRGFSLGGLLFVLAILSKPQVSALPGMIFILSLMSFPRRWKQTALEMFVWALPVLAVATVTFKTQKQYVPTTIEFWQRPIVMMDSYGFYLTKLAWPSPLSVDYARTPQYLLRNIDINWGPTLAFILVTAFVLFRLFNNKDRITAGFYLVWLAALLPVSGIVDFAFQDISTTANHYNYFPMVAMALLSLPAAQALQKVPAKFLWLPGALAVGVLTFLSWNRAQIWQSPETFFQDMAKGNPTSYSAHIGLGGAATVNKDYQKALQYYQGALTLRPGDVPATANVMTSLAQLGRYQEVMNMESYLLSQPFVMALQMHPIATANILTTFGATTYSLQMKDLTLLYFCKAAALQPHVENITTALKRILEEKRRENPQINCPAVEPHDKFLQLVYESLVSRKKIQPQ